MDKRWKKPKKPYLSRVLMWKTYKQKRSCKREKDVHIILIQEDSMFGGCVF